MKKLVLSAAMLSVALLAVGCGQKTTPVQDTTPNSENTAVKSQGATANTVVSDNAEADTTVKNVENNGEVVADAATVTLAQCMKENGVKMYGTERCGHCKSQKAMFGDAFTYIDYTDCDANKDSCIAAGVKGFPTWIDTKGNTYPGTQELSTLAKVA